MGTHLKSLENFPDSAKFTRLELAENQLTGDELKHLKKYASSLETLKLGNNKITKWADVEQLGCMKKLKNLDLEKNDVTKIDGYTEKMWALFEGSALEILDNHNREGEEGFSEDIDDYGSSLDNEGEGKLSTTSTAMKASKVERTTWT